MTACTCPASRSTTGCPVHSPTWAPSVTWTVPMTTLTVPDWVHMAEVPPTDHEPSCCELACYEDPGCSCDGCRPAYGVADDDEDSDLWAGVALLLTVALAALAVGVLIGRVTA